MAVTRGFIPSAVCTSLVWYLLLSEVIRPFIGSISCPVVYFAVTVIPCLTIVQTFIASWLIASFELAGSSIHTPNCRGTHLDCKVFHTPNGDGRGGYWICKTCRLSILSYPHSSTVARYTIQFRPITLRLSGVDRSIALGVAPSKLLPQNQKTR